MSIGYNARCLIHIWWRWWVLAATYIDQKWNTKFIGKLERKFSQFCSKSVCNKQQQQPKKDAKIALIFLLLDASKEISKFDQMNLIGFSYILSSVFILMHDIVLYEFNWDRCFFLFACFLLFFSLLASLLPFSNVLFVVAIKVTESDRSHWRN